MTHKILRGSPVQSEALELPPVKPPSTVTLVALKVLEFLKEAAFHTALTAVKIVVLPVELAAIALVASITAFAAIGHVAVRLAGYKGITPQQFLGSCLYGLTELVKITLLLGLHPKEEDMQLVDSKPDSPKCVVITPRVRGDCPPILYAPGYLDTPVSLRKTCRRIADMANAPVYIVHYRSLFQSIEEHAKDVARVQERIMNDTKRNDIIIAGHSMGGLTTGLFIQNMPKDKVQIKHWITIASPLQGTPVSKIGLGECAKDMNPGSRMVQQLNRASVLDSIPTLHIYSPIDLIVPAGAKPYREHSKATIYECQFPWGHLGVRENPEVEAQLRAVFSSAI